MTWTANENAEYLLALEDAVSEEAYIHRGFESPPSAAL